MSYHVMVKAGVKKDLNRIKKSNLSRRLLAIIDQLRKNPYEANQSFEKLQPPVKGFYSRRITLQHRVVYTINEKKKEVIVWSAYSHYK